MTFAETIGDVRVTTRLVAVTQQELPKQDKFMLEFEAGGPPPVSREADDLLRGAETFLGLIRAALED